MATDDKIEKAIKVLNGMKVQIYNIRKGAKEIQGAGKPWSDFKGTLLYESVDQIEGLIKHVKWLLEE